MGNSYKHSQNCICPVCQPCRKSRRAEDRTLKDIAEMIDSLPQIEKQCKCPCGSYLFCVTPHSCYCAKCGQHFEHSILNLLTE